MQNQGEIDRLNEESSELVSLAGDSRITVTVQQVTSRFKSVQATSKVSFEFHSWREYHIDLIYIGNFEEMRN